MNTKVPVSQALRPAHPGSLWSLGKNVYSTLMWCFAVTRWKFVTKGVNGVALKTIEIVLVPRRLILSPTVYTEDDSAGEFNTSQKLRLFPSKKKKVPFFNFYY